MLKAYKYRLYPSKEQEVLLSKHFGCARYTYNRALAYRIASYEAGEKKNCLDAIKEITDWKKDAETSWLCEVDSQSLQMAVRNLALIGRVPRLIFQSFGRELARFFIGSSTVRLKPSLFQERRQVNILPAF